MTTPVSPSALDSPAPDSPAPDSDAHISASLGQAIRAARRERGLSMRGLSATADVSQPFLSQIESGQALPSVVTLFRIAKALGLSPSSLLPALPEPARIVVSRHDEGGHVAVDDSGTDATSRVLSSGAATLATVQEYSFPADAPVGEWFESDGEITAYVLEGTITAEIDRHTIDGEDACVLRAGDAIAHPGALRNRWSIDGGQPARVLLVYAHASARTPGAASSSAPAAASTTVHDSEISAPLGSAVRAARTARGLSMRALARAAAISQPFLSTLENGQAMPSLVTLYRIAAALELSPFELLPSIGGRESITVRRREADTWVPIADTADAAAHRVLSAGAARLATVQEYVVEPGQFMGDWYESDGELTVYVAEGEITVELAEHGSWDLVAGDAIAHPGGIRNRWSVRGEGRTRIILVYAGAR